MVSYGLKYQTQKTYWHIVDIHCTVGYDTRILQVSLDVITRHLVEVVIAWTSRRGSLQWVCCWMVLPCVGSHVWWCQIHIGYQVNFRLYCSYTNVHMHKYTIIYTCLEMCVFVVYHVYYVHFCLFMIFADSVRPTAWGQQTHLWKHRATYAPRQGSGTSQAHPVWVDFWWTSMGNPINKPVEKSIDEICLQKETCIYIYR